MLASSSHFVVFSVPVLRATTNSAQSTACVTATRLARVRLMHSRRNTMFQTHTHTHTCEHTQNDGYWGDACDQPCPGGATTPCSGHAITAVCIVEMRVCVRLFEVFELCFVW